MYCENRIGVRKLTVTRRSATSGGEVKRLPSSPRPVVDEAGGGSSLVGASLIDRTSCELVQSDSAHETLTCGKCAAAACPGSMHQRHGAPPRRMRARAATRLRRWESEMCVARRSHPMQESPACGSWNALRAHAMSCARLASIPEPTARPAGWRRGPSAAIPAVRDPPPTRFRAKAVPSLP